MRIGINGLGRIGRRLVRLLNERPNIELVAVNELADIGTIAHLLKYDSVHGVLTEPLEVLENRLIIQGRPVAYYSFRNPEDIPWDEYDVDFVIDSTGVFKTKKELSAHLKTGVRHVVLSAPPADDTIKTIVPGINDHSLSRADVIVSNASCTTNSAAPLVDIIDKLCGIRSGYITTVHSYTNDQRLQDAPHRDLRRARAAAHSIVPTTTGAAKAITRVFPQLEGKLGGCGIRVPVPNGSLTDISYVVDHPVSVAEINRAFKDAADGYLRGILEYTEDPIVSSDIIGNTHSCIFDAQLTSVIDHMVKVVGWYDNETGYSSRLLDVTERLDRL
jgi:glyceraldehyde 3-phosphate dehydrogenase